MHASPCTYLTNYGLFTVELQGFLSLWIKPIDVTQRIKTDTLLFDHYCLWFFLLPVKLLMFSCSLEVVLTASILFIHRLMSTQVCIFSTTSSRIYVKSTEQEFGVVFLLLLEV